MKKLIEPKNLFALVLLVVCLSTGFSMLYVPEVEVSPDTISISPSSGSTPSLKADWDHILYGDETGGGHLYGTGKPCKSEFPADWSETQIMQELTRLAANDNADWREEKNGYMVSEQTVKNLKIRVVLDPKNSEIVTGYPLNVRRNPCPAPANDP